MLVMAVIAPWMLGTTTLESIWVLNGLGFALGGLWILRRGIVSMNFVGKPSASESSASNWAMAGVWAMVIIILLYVGCSALNPKASLFYTFTPGYSIPTGVDIYYLNPIEWLPQTYDQSRTLRAFWKYLAICWFLATFSGSVAR